MCLSGVLKDIILVVASVMIWANTVTPLQVFGYGTALLGLVWYKQSKLDLRYLAIAWGLLLAFWVSTWLLGDSELPSTGVAGAGARTTVVELREEEIKALARLVELVGEGTVQIGLAPGHGSAAVGVGVEKN
ncbi:hypothetical protein HDU96_002401 [Phlyctochytrium bullatum]|nr:hypothetical protein HDU96_002401 [Phlyctochytrium bullatum]